MWAVIQTIAVVFAGLSVSCAIVVAILVVRGIAEEIQSTDHH